MYLASLPQLEYANSLLFGAKLHICVKVITTQSESGTLLMTFLKQKHENISDYPVLNTLYHSKFEKLPFDS